MLYLNPGFSELQPHGQLLPREDVWVLGLLEGPLQLVQLEGGEGGSGAPDLPGLVAVLQLPVLQAEGQLLLLLSVVDFLLGVGFLKGLAGLLARFTWSKDSLDKTWKGVSYITTQRHYLLIYIFLIIQRRAL